MKNMPRVKDLTRQIFGRLTVIERSGSQSGHATWKCRCECGNEVTVMGSNLTQNKISSCGCLKKEKQAKWGASTLRDLTNQKFGNLLVIRRAEEKEKIDKFGKKRPVWECQCDCGNICYVSRQALTSGNTKSCGCIHSFGEQKITKILQELNIDFIKEYPLLINGIYYRIDFAIKNNNTIKCFIEYDGEQHFGYTGKGWNTQENYLKIKERDEIKNSYAKENNIPLFRISYKDFEQVSTDYLKNLIDF